MGLERLGQLCAVVSQVSLALSEASLVLGQLSVTVGQVVAAVSQISLALSQYVFVAGQLGGLVLQAGAALKGLSDAVDGFSREMQRFSVCVVQVSAALRHVAVTAARLGRAASACVAGGGLLPTLRRASAALCGLGVALGELAALVGLLTALDAQLARLASVRVASSRTCLAVLHYASRARQLSAGVAQLSAALYQLSLALRTAASLEHGLHSLSRGCHQASELFLKRLLYATKPHEDLARRLVSKLEGVLVAFGIEQSRALVPLSAAPASDPRDTLVLVQHVDHNKFTYVTLVCPKELLSLYGRLWKKKRPGEARHNDGDLMRFHKSKTTTNSYVVALCEFDSVLVQLQIPDLLLYSNIPTVQSLEHASSTPETPTEDLVPKEPAECNQVNDVTSIKAPHSEPSDIELITDNFSSNIFVKVFSSFDCPECYPVCHYGVVGFNVLL